MRWGPPRKTIHRQASPSLLPTRPSAHHVHTWVCHQGSARETLISEEPFSLFCSFSLLFKGELRFSRKKNFTLCAQSGLRAVDRCARLSPIVVCCPHQL